MNYKIFKNVFLSIVLVEMVSFLSYFYPFINKTAFLAVVLLSLVLSLYKLEYGILIIFAELIIGSKGYLFYFNFDGFSISIRIALWLIIMSVWAGKVISGLISDRTAFKAIRSLRGLEFLKSPFAKYFIILFIFITWGIINGFLKGNSFNNLFFDFNGWLYFLIVFPVYDAMKETHQPLLTGPACPAGRQAGPFKRGVVVFTAAILCLCLKTFFLLFIFSHFSMDAVYEIYHWVRATGVGEIAQIQGGFYRIFFQSHIFALIGLFVILALFSCPDAQYGNKKNNFLLFTFYFLLFSTVIISFSRSFWIGLAFGLILIFTYLIWQKISIKKIIQIGLFFLLSVFISIGFITMVVKFPYPRPTGGFNTAELLSERASEISNEAAVASRWALLPELWKEIKTAPIFGKGFGATVTYKSSDPRALEQNLNGEYTTYAFEWGWLDIWLKLGFFGMAAYIFLIGKIIYDGLFKMSNIELLIGLAIIVVVNIFTPYLNHPLGIGYLILVSAIINENKKGVLKLTPNTK